MRGITVPLLVLGLIVTTARSDSVQQQAQAWLQVYNSTAEQQLYKDVVAQWNYYTNVNATTQQAMAKADAAYSTWAQTQAVKARTFDKTKITDPRTLRLLSKIGTVGIKLNSSDTQQLSTLTAQMIDVYSNAKICGWSNGKKNCSIQWLLDPDIFNVLQTSRDPAELTYVWNEWRNKTGQLKDKYQQFVTLSNKGAKAGGFADTGAWWRSWYETQNFRQQIQTLFYQVLPLYEQLHTYVRRHLNATYPGYVNDSFIPAQLTGNMWGQEWQNIFPLVQPFKNVTPVDVTAAMKTQGYDAKKMFHTADNFFQSLGLIPMPKPFWDKSIITKPNHPFVCHASAWDFYNRKDFRIKMCTEVDMNDLITIHHEMGHIQYYLQYSQQPVTFREGANPGFHEGIGDTLALSVSTPKHLQAIGLLKNYTSNYAQDINYLLKQAMEKVAFLPWGYLMDLYRWEVFNGSASYDQWNNKWWDLRHRLQGIKAPVPRPANAFDPAAKSHIDDNTPYIRYFVSFIVQFQFYETMCQAAGWKGDLYKCDFYQNRAAGTRMANMLSMGSSQPWPKAMSRMTGQSQMSASSIKKYFKPLTDWLGQQNGNAKDCFGWGVDGTYPKSVLCTLPTPRCGPVAYPDCSTPKPSTTTKATKAATTVTISLITLLAAIIVPFLATLNFKF
jgi:peptidyl-dipeptidase A